MQRLLDILFSGIALLVLSPFLVPVALILRFTGEGEIFFRQSRVGRDGRMFHLLKFATMLKNSPNMGTGTVTLKDDPRVLPFGRFLRKTKLNELPQLLNIFLGDMSIIGPRPQTSRCFNAFPERSQAAIVTVPPGLSGVGSIVFRREEEMMHAAKDPDRFYDHVIAPYKGLLEEWYVRRRSVGLYLHLIVLTAWVVLFPRSSIVWRSFPDLPPPPDELAADMNWPGAAAAPHDAATCRQVADIHAASINQGFLSSLGPRFLTQLYRAIDRCDDSVLIVEKNGDQVVGFVTGSRGMGAIYRQLLRNGPALCLALAPLIVQPRKVLGILEILRHSRNHDAGAGLPEHELLSIAVVPEFRGTGVAERLYNSLVHHFQERGVHGFRIVVGESLAPAHRFYRRMGAQPAATVEVHAGRSSTIYVHSLPQRAAAAGAGLTDRSPGYRPRSGKPTF